MALYPCIFFNNTPTPTAPHIYGVYWDGTSTTQWTRTDDSANFDNPNPYYNGMLSTPSSPFDDLMPWVGMQIVEDENVGTLVSIPKFWYKITQDDTIHDLKIQISDSEIEGFYVSPAHMDRGDGNGERDVVYMGRYLCDSTYKSTTGVSPKHSTIRSNFRTNIHNLGTDIWQQDFTMRFTIWLLYLVEYANWNSQSTIGFGCSLNNTYMNTGYTDSMPYHTGTITSSREAYGGIQYRYIEGLWDNLREWLDGCYTNNNGLNIILNPTEFAESGGISLNDPTGLRIGYPSMFTLKEINNMYPVFVPTAYNGASSNTYSCDDWNSGGSSYPVLLTGGYYGSSLEWGLFYISYDSASDANSTIGSRIMKLP